jgi:galactose oxidase
MTVTSNEPILQVSMIRMGSSTHGVNLDQRRLELCGDTSKSCKCELTATVVVPASGIAIAGYYMVFVVNAAGVPSIGEVVQVAL